MKTIFRRILARAVALGLLAAAPLALATPTISFVTPASGSTIASAISPGTVPVTVTAGATAGSSIVSVQFFDNGTSIGTVAGVSPFTVQWTPTVAGTHNLSATVTDTSTVTTGASANSNTSTVNSFVTVTTARAVIFGSSAAGFSPAQGSEIYLRATAAMSDAIVGSVQFYVGATPIGAAVTQAPYNVQVLLDAAVTPGVVVGANSFTAVATSSDGSITVTSAATVINVPAKVGTSPTISLSTSAPGGVVPVNQNVTLTATASDADGFIPSTAGGGVTFLVDGDPITPVGPGETNPRLVAPYSVTWKPTVAKASPYKLQAQTVDDKNNIVLSSITNITVTVATVAPTVSLTSPSAGASLGVGTVVPLTATAAGNGGATVTKVDFLSGSTVLGTAISSPYTFNWTPSAAGAVSLTARVTDSNGAAVTSSAVSVTVVTAAPTVSITSPSNGASVAFGTSTTVTAAAAANGGATVGRVDFLAGTTVIGTALVAPYTVTWSPTASGIVALTAKVTDSNGTTITSTVVNVIVTAPSVTLTAPAAGSTATLGVGVALIASASAVAPATVAKVEFFAGTTLVNTVLTAPYTMTWIPTATGAVSLTAKVTDSNGASVTSSTVSVTVNPSAAPTVAITAPAIGSVVTAGTTVTLSAAATPGAGATVAQVQFFVGLSTIIGTTTTGVAGVYSVSWTPSTAGNFSLTARVLDSANNAVTSTAVTVTAVVATSVSLTAPANNSTAVAGTAVTVTASATAVLGATITQVAFFENGVAIAAPVTTAPFTLAWTPAAAGAVGLTAQATDSLGTVAASFTVNVTVGNAPPTVTLTAPAIGTVVSFATPLALTANASAVAPASVVKVDFFVGSTFVGTALAAPYTVNWTPTSTGTQSITAKVTDSNGAVVTSAAVSVIVTNVTPVATLTSPTTGTSLVVGIPVALTATGTAGGGASVTRVDFLTNSSTIVGTALVAVGGVYTVNWTPTTATNALNISARVTDSNNAVDTSNVATVSVTSTTTLGVALAITGGSATIPGGSSRVLTATVSGLAAIAQVAFYYDGTLIGTDSIAPFNVLFTAPSTVGPHILTAQAIDGSGGVASSPNVSVTITGAIGDPPTVGLMSPVSGSFLPVNTTTAITGVATDSDGSISTVQVFANGVSIGNASLTGSAWTINWSPTTLGAISLSAIATDNNGNAVAAPPVGVFVADSSSPGITLAVSPGNTTLPVGATRNIVASVSASSGRAVVRVEFFVDGTKVGEDTALPYNFRYVAPPLDPQEQTHTFILSARATDNAGAARDAQLPLLIVSPVGQPPSVSLLTPTTGAFVVPGTAVSLAATALASGGTISSVQFYVNGSPATVNNGNPITNAPYISSFTPTVPGSYTIDAIATDDRGNNTVSSAATISAAFATPTIAITAPNPNATARALPNVPLTLTAIATIGPGSAVLLVEFLLDGSQIGARTTPTNNATGSYSFAWTPLAAQLGLHVLTARVTDTNSQIATSAPVNVNVASAVGTAPTVTISVTPVPGQGLQTLSAVNFIANAFANGAGSTLTNVEFFLNDASIGVATREQATNLYRLAYDFSRFDFTVVTPDGNGRFPVALYAIARDSNNNQTVSTTTNLAINPATSSPPSIQLTSLPPTTVSQGAQVLFNPTFSDGDGSVTQLQLYANGVLVSTTPNPQLGQTVLTYNASTVGRFNVFAVATDDTGNTAISTPAIVINVTAINAPATAITQPSDNATVTTVNSPVFLEGTASNKDTTQIPSLVFIATASGGTRTTISGTRIGTTTTYRAIWTPTTPDTYTVATQATVGVISGTSTASRRVVVNNVVGLAPIISISAPSSATTASSANLIATATDSDGSVIGVEFFLNRQSIGQAVRDQLTNTWRLTASFAGLIPGSIEVVARATDSDGNVAASSTLSINVTAASGIAPTITITPSTTEAAFSRQVQLTANARDTDGTVTSVQYFANGSSIGSNGNASTSYQVNWTPTTSGLFSLYAIATDNTGNTTISPAVLVNVHRNNPILETSAFILQTYQDIANTTTINPLVFANLDAQLAAGTLTRADIVLSLTDEPGFLPPVNLLAAYYVLMGQWPTPQNYNTLIATARNSLSNAVGSILSANEYFAKFGVVPTTALLDNPNSVLPAETFLNQLYQSAGLGTPSALNRVQFRSNNVLSATLGRGYAATSLNGALAEFITNTNSTNTVLFNQARAAALFYELDQPPISMTTDEIAVRVATLARLPDLKAMVNAALTDVLYGYRYVTITKHPESLTVAPRSGALFSVEASGAPPLTYQWLLNGAPIPGATSPLLSLTNVNTSRVGTYTVAITSSVSSATSDPATLTLSNAATRLGNISTRGVTTGGANVMIGGFVVSGTANQTRQMLIRVIGPSLAGLGVTGALNNPRLEVYSGAGQTPILTNDDWGSQTGGNAAVTALQQATNRAGAFQLGTNSTDAAVLATLSPGSYTVLARGPAANPNASGVVLIEVYDVTQGGGAGPKAVNVSTRGDVGTGADILIAGFVVNGGVSRRMLIRGVGPTLRSFGLGNNAVLADPQITLVDQATGVTIKTNDDWASGEDAAVIAAAATSGGAFPLANGSKDAAMIVMLAPGAYTVQLSGVGNTTGIGIVEVYDVDP